MRPVDIQAMIDLAKAPDAPVMLCQAGYVFVNTEVLSHHPQIQNQLQQRIESRVLTEVTQCSGDGVNVYCTTTPPVPAARAHKQELAKLFKLNKT